MIRLSILAAVLAGICCVGVLAQTSKPPSPGRGPSQSRQPQRQARGADQQPAPDPRGTDKAPLVVHVQPTPKTNEETAKEKAQEDRETSAYRWTIGLGIATGILGLLQLIAIGFQAKIASKQNKIIGTQNDIMRGQREAADRQTEYMRDGLAETRKAAQAAKDNADAALLAVKATKVANRQWVQVSDWKFQFDRLTGTNVNQPWLKFRVTVTNSTPLPLTLICARCVFDIRKGGYVWSNTVLGPGESETCEMSDMPDEKRYASMRGPGGKISILGWVHYFDAFGDEQAQVFGGMVHFNTGLGNNNIHIQPVASLHRHAKIELEAWPLDEDVKRGETDAPPRTQQKKPDQNS